MDYVHHATSEMTNELLWPLVPLVFPVTTHPWSSPVLWADEDRVWRDPVLLLRENGQRSRSVGLDGSIFMLLTLSIMPRGSDTEKKSGLIIYLKKHSLQVRSKTIHKIQMQLRANATESYL
jgi:hypothetical protein